MLEAVIVFVLGLAIVWLVVTTLAVRTIKRANVRDKAFDRGGEAARLIIERRGLEPVKVRNGDVDAYLAGEQVIQLADGRMMGQSLAAVAIAAHEAGHAAQHRDGATAWRVWWSLGWPTIAAGFLIIPAVIAAVVTGASWTIIVTLVLLAVMLTAGLVSALVERAATRWALAALTEEELIDPEQLPAARRVVQAAAAVYVAETIWDPGLIFRRLFSRWAVPPADNGSMNSPGPTPGGGGGGGE